MSYQPELFRQALPRLRPFLEGLEGKIPALLSTYDRYVARLGEDCMYARATLKLIFLEARCTDAAGLEAALRERTDP